MPNKHRHQGSHLCNYAMILTEVNSTEDIENKIEMKNAEVVSSVHFAKKM